MAFQSKRAQATPLAILLFLSLLGSAPCLGAHIQQEQPKPTEQREQVTSATTSASSLASLAPIPAHKRLRVAVYKGVGAGEASRKVLMSALSKDTAISLEDITAEAIRAGKLDGYDALVQPGGSGGGQGKALGEEGRAKVKAFVLRGGAYLGVCAGAYLATNDYSWGLGILNARVRDKAHWARGNGPVEVAPTLQGRKRLGVDGDGTSLSIIYWQGPLLVPGQDASLPSYQEWATFQGEIARKGAPRGVMPGTTAIAAAAFGAGRVVCFSPHPEKTAGQEPLLHHALVWATRSASAAPKP